MITTVKKSFGSLKSKDDKETSNDIEEIIGKPEIEIILPASARDLGDHYSKKVDMKYITEQIFKDAAIPVKGTDYIPKSERLLAIYDMLTDKSFPRKGPGKSTKIKILDAIIMAAIDKKLILQGA